MAGSSDKAHIEQMKKFNEIIDELGKNRQAIAELQKVIVNLDKQNDRLQIDIAKLQADIQIWLTLTVTFLAAAGASVIAEWQVLSSLSSPPSLMQGLSVAVFGFLIIFFAIEGVISAKKADSYMKQLENLK
jgi:hypothetical protein